MNTVSRIIFTLAVLILCLPVIGQAEPGRSDSNWRVIELPGTGEWLEGRTTYRQGSVLDRSGAIGKGEYYIYLVDLAPGADYTLGLRYPVDAGARPSVTLFDRWPMDPGAKRYRLPMGPVVRTNNEKIEYRWRLGVSSRSGGNLAFVVVDAGSGLTAARDRFRHFMYLTTPAVRPQNQFGTGITYLRGPSDLMLQKTAGIVDYIVEYPFRRSASSGDYGEEWRLRGNLVFNGDFRQGLQGWEVLAGGTGSGSAGRVVVGDEGLLLRIESPDVQLGVSQMIKRDVHGARSLRLALDLRFDRRSDKRLMDADEPAAVELIICYLDAERSEHCGSGAYRQSFSAGNVNRRGGQFVGIKMGEWYRFEDELMDLNPEPDVIESISITGAGPKNNEILIGGVILAVQ